LRSLQETQPDFVEEAKA